MCYGRPDYIPKKLSAGLEKAVLGVGGYLHFTTIRYRALWRCSPEGASEDAQAVGKQWCGHQEAQHMFLAILAWKLQLTLPTSLQLFQAKPDRVHELTSKAHNRWSSSPVITLLGCPKLLITVIPNFILSNFSIRWGADLVKYIGRDTTFTGDYSCSMQTLLKISELWRPTVFYRFLSSSLHTHFVRCWRCVNFGEPAWEWLDILTCLWILNPIGEVNARGS